MSRRVQTRVPDRPGLSFILLLVFLAMLWLAGGASRADVLGQVVVRAAAWFVVVILLVFAQRPSLHGVRAVGAMVAAALLLALLQLVPMPPALWQALPGRDLLASAIPPGEAQPWRPWSIVPGATWNAAAALIVPLVTLVLLAGISPGRRASLTTVLLALVAGSALVGLVQFAGVRLSNPFINATPGEVSGSFANRNHFALFLAMGCALAPVWAFRSRQQVRARGGIALGIVLLFALTILASGSRTGMLLGVLGIAFGLGLTIRPLRQEFCSAPRWALPACLAGIVATIAVFVAISVASDRAASISRVVSVEGGEDMRVRALPTVLSMIGAYFPVGTGFGSFDPIFRIHEPFALLKLTYFNHAHNDFLEIVLDGGLPALLLLAAAVGWWAVASIGAWRSSAFDVTLPRLGSVLILLTLVASVVDYPVRTPLIMAVIVIAAVWLAGTPQDVRQPLPQATPRL